MKKFFVILLTLILVFAFVSCTEKSNKQSSESVGENTTDIDTHNEPQKNKYTGNYHQEPVYKKLMEFENCKDPEVLCQLLFDLYGEEITYIKLTYINTDDGKYLGYEEPYDDFICTSIALYDTLNPLCKVPICSDTYLFFRPYTEEPIFMMDCDASYLVSSYKINNYEDGTRSHNISGWIISDLFMCLHGYTDAAPEEKNNFKEAVRYMDFYLDFENLVIESIGEETGNITKTESLTPCVNILSVDISDSSMYKMNIKYEIKNISEKRGVVYLSCSGHAYQDELHFNDEKFENDYRKDGSFDYDVHYAGRDFPVTLTIFYGYGDFDPYEGWDKEQTTTVTILYAEDYGKISSTTIPENEIFPLYFDGKYIGAWTTHISGDLIEIDTNSTSIPFEKHNKFKSEKGEEILIENVEGEPSITVNGVLVGTPTDMFEDSGITYYSFWYNNSIFFVNRYPNDEYIKLQGIWPGKKGEEAFLYP